MIRADNSVGLVFHIDNASLPVQPSPYARSLTLAVVAWTSPVADGAIVLVPSTRTGSNADVICTVSAFKKIHVFDNAVLDIKQFFA